MKTLTSQEAKGLIELINKLDSIAISLHSNDVAHIALIGHTSDVLALDSYLMKKKRMDEEAQKELDLDPDLSKR